MSNNKCDGNVHRLHHRISNLVVDKKSWPLLCVVYYIVFKLQLYSVIFDWNNQTTISILIETPNATS